MPTTKLKTEFIYVPITRIDEETRIIEGYCFCNERVQGDVLSVSRKAMEDATAEYMRWGAVRSMHQPIAAGTAEAIVWDENGCMLRAKIVDDQEWRKVKERVYKGFSIGVRPELVRGNSVEKLSWVENSLVDRPKDPDAVFTVARAEGFDPGEEFECEVEETADAEPITYSHNDPILTPVERATVGEDGEQNADPNEIGFRPIKASDCTITREGELYVLNGPEGALIGKFKSEAEARKRALEVQDAMKDGDGGKDDATDQHGTTLVLPTDRAEEPVIAEGEELDLIRAEDGSIWNLIRMSNGEVVHQAESIEAAGVWIKAALARAVTAATPSLPVRENLEGKSPKEKRADGDGDMGDAKGPHICRYCSAEYGRCMAERADGAQPETEKCPHCSANLAHEDAHADVCPSCGLKLDRPEKITETPDGIHDEDRADKADENGHDSPPKGYPDKKSEYADPKNFKYPIDTEEHVRAALSYIAKAKNAGEYSSDELSAIKGRIHAAAKKFGIEASDDEKRADAPTLTTIARLETDNAALILRAETSETEFARVQTAKEGLTRDLAAAKEQITRLEAMPAPQQPLRFAHAVTREFFANAKLDHDGETARIVARMTEITSMAPTQDLGEQSARAQEYQLLKMALAGRA